MRYSIPMATRTAYEVWGVTSEIPAQPVFYDEASARTRARIVAILTGVSTIVEPAFHGSYVPVEWCDACTPQKNCQALTFEEEMAMDMDYPF